MHAGLGVKRGGVRGAEAAFFVLAAAFFVGVGATGGRRGAGKRANGFAGAVENAQRERGVGLGRDGGGGNEVVDLRAGERGLGAGARGVAVVARGGDAMAVAGL